MQCSSCQNQDMEYKSGTSKTTGKKWQGWKCEPCNLMHGMNGVPWGDKPKAQATPEQRTSSTPLNEMKTIMSKIDKILAILEKKNGYQLEKESQESPF